MSVSPKLRFVLGFVAFFTLLWFLWDTEFVYPVKVFVVLLHELGHAMAALATGGSVERIELNPDQGGVTHALGGNSFVMLSAGYLGSLFWGVLLCRLAGWRRLSAGFCAGAFGTAIILATAGFVRNGFGLIFGIAFGLCLVLLGRFAPPMMNRGVLLSLGLVSVLYAILDIKSDILDRPEAPSDAYFLAELTGVPTLAWGVLWIAVAGFVAWRELARAYRNA